MKLGQNRNILNTPSPAKKKKKKCNLTFFTEWIHILTLDIHHQNVTLNKHSNTQLSAKFMHLFVLKLLIIPSLAYITPVILHRNKL